MYYSIVASEREELKRIEKELVDGKTMEEIVTAGDEGRGQRFKRKKNDSDSDVVCVLKKY